MRHIKNPKSDKYEQNCQNYVVLNVFLNHLYSQHKSVLVVQYFVKYMYNTFL